MIEKGIELVTVRLLDGPHKGTRFVPIDKIGGFWPLPNELALEGGSYVKVSESDLPGHVATCRNVARGAQYRWEAE